MAGTNAKNTPGGGYRELDLRPLCASICAKTYGDKTVAFINLNLSLTRRMISRGVV